MRRLLLCVALATIAPFAIAAPAEASFGFEPGSFTATATNADGTLDTQAGSHPFAYTVAFNFKHEAGGNVEGSARDIIVDLPPGLVGNANALPRCTQAQFDQTQGPLCSGATQVGTLNAEVDGINPHGPVFNLVPPPGVAVRLGFAAGGLNALEDGSVRTGQGYGVAVTDDLLPKPYALTVHETIWGVPADPAHDAERVCALKTPTVIEYPEGCASGAPEQPFLTLPTSCTGPLSTTVSADSREAPGLFVSATTLSLDAGGDPTGLVGCGLLPFGPTISVQPETSAASTPTGVTVRLHMPQPESPNGFAEADLKDATVTMPTGLVINPSAAGGLGGCSSAAVALSSPEPAACPSDSKIGSVEVNTPLIAHPLPGAIYLASQGDNPFGSLLAIYVVVDDPESGVVIKLAGHVELDPQTGRLTTTFSENPQLPFEDFTLHFFGGPRAQFVTPSACGTFGTTADLTPWTSPEGADATPSSSFDISESCNAPGFAPALSAGATDAQAGAYSPFALSFSRQDHEQPFGGITVTMPPGLLGSLSHVAKCPEPQAASGDCGPESLIGETSVAVGAGPDPYWVTGGKAYLTGPYNGGPFGLSIVVPTTAGPLTLTGNGGFGKEVVRSSIRVDPRTSQITVVSDPLPTIIEGIPLQIRTVNVDVNRPGFMFNPTSCGEQSVNGAITSAQGAQAPVADRFQVGSCASLAFHPKFTVSTQGNGAFNQNGASLKVDIATGQGPQSNPAIPTEANIKKVDVQLPLQLPSRLATLQKACTEGQFAANPAGCPSASNVGSATARTPVLPDPLTGPAYLVSHGGAAFPDLDIVLRGDGVTIVLTGNTDIKRGVTFSRFDTNPDAPISSFELNLPEGRFSALSTNGTNLCAPTATVKRKKRVAVRRHGHTVQVLKTVTQRVATSLTMPTTITAQNGAVLTQTTKVAVTGCPKAKANGAKRGRGASARRQNRA